MAVKILITVEGSEQVKSAVDDVKKHFEGLASSLNGIGQDAKGGTAFQDVSLQLQNMKPRVEEASNATRQFRETLHVFHPILRAAGIEVGAFGSFARAASAGLAGLGVAISGGIIVALGKLEEQSKKTKTELSGLLGSRASGETIFGTLEQSAKELGTTVESLAPAFQSATIALNRFKQTSGTAKFVALRPEDLPVANIKDTAKAIENLFKIIRAGGQDNAEATNSAKAFFDALQNGGRLTKDILDRLPTGTVRLLAEALGRGSETTEQFRAEVEQLNIPIDRVIQLLAKFGPQAKSAFDKDAVKTFGDELARVVREFTDDFRELVGISFSDFIIGEIRGVADGIKTSIQEFKAIRDTVSNVLFKQTDQGTVADLRAKATAEADQLKTVQPFKLSDLFGAKDAWDDIAKSIEETSNIAVTTGQEMLQVWNTPPDLTAWQGSFQSAFDNVVSLAQSAFNQIQSIFSQTIQMNFSGFGGQPLGAPFAGGGLVRGPGTTTSDSILARLSDKEFVLRANATQFYGIDFLNALNSLRIPKMPGFSMGGLVDAMARSMPRFAEGGMVIAQQTPITLVIDQQRFNMTATGDTVKALSRFAVARQVTSTGRKPSWIR